MRVQKRFIYAGILGAIGFAVTYLFLNIEIIYALLLTIVIYIAGIFIFKEKDVRNYSLDDVNRYYFLTSKLLNYNQRINNQEIKDDIQEISDISSKILSALTQKPNKVTQVFNFYDYYMNLTINLIDKYSILEKKDVRSTKEQNFMNKMVTYIENIKREFKKQQDNMYKTKSLNIDQEIELFEKICAIESLDEEIDSGDGND